MISDFKRFVFELTWVMVMVDPDTVGGYKYGNGNNTITPFFRAYYFALSKTKFESYTLSIILHFLEN